MLFRLMHSFQPAGNWRKLLSPVALLILAAFAPEHAGSTPVYKMAILIGKNNYFEIHGKNIIKDLETSASHIQGNGYRLEISLYRDAREFRLAIKEGRVRLAMSPIPDFYLEAQSTVGAEPFGRLRPPYQNTIPWCFYTSRKNPAANLKSLKNQPLVMAGSRLLYFKLRERLGHSPLAFFQTIDPLENGMEAALQVERTHHGAALLPIGEFNFLKIFNPAAAASLKPVECFNDIPGAPIFSIGKPLPVAHRDALLTLLKNPWRDPFLSKYHTLAKVMKLRFAPATKADYANVLELLQKGRKDGWQQEYEQWLSNKNAPPGSWPGYDPAVVNNP